MQGASALMACASSKVTARESGSGDRADRGDVADDLGAHCCRNWRAIAPIATRDAVSRALARSSTLRMSSWPYLTTPARSAWPGRGRVTAGRSRRGAFGRLRLDVHRALPVLPILVGDHQRDRRTGGEAVADAAQRLRPIGFDGHPAAAAVAALAPPQFGGDRVEIDRQTGRHAFEDGDERLAVRLAGSEKTQHRGLILSEVFAHPDRAAAEFRVNSRGRDFAIAESREERMQLLADRFVSSATTRRRSISPQAEHIALTVAAAGGDSEQRRWALSCDEAERCRHPAVPWLVDYGMVGGSQRFEARRIPPAGAAPPIGPHRPGIIIVPRPAVAAISEMFEAPQGVRPRFITLWGPHGAGKHTMVGDLARCARLRGFVPVAAHVLAVFAEPLRGRSLFVIDDGDQRAGWPDVA